MTEIRVPAGLVVEAAMDAGEDIPCILELSDDGCDNQATHMVPWVHTEDGTTLCGAPEEVPMCWPHVKELKRARNPFWQNLMGFELPVCSICDKAWESGPERRIK